MRCGGRRTSRSLPSRHKSRSPRGVWARALASPRFTADYREILRDPTVDAVHILTPNALHYSMAKEALEAGKHVACEKPLAVTVEEAEELVSSGREEGPAQLRLPQSALLPHGAAVASHERGRRVGRDPLRAGRLFAGLAALRHGLELAHRREGRRRVALHGRHRLALV
jgi:hypothetical protein